MLKEEFTEWANNGGIRSQDSGYISHAIDVLEWWLDSKLPNAGVGNLFRYESGFSVLPTCRNRMSCLPSHLYILQSHMPSRTGASAKRQSPSPTA